MTLSTVVTQVASVCTGITGIISVFVGDWDAVVPDSSTPFVRVRGEFGAGEPLTMGSGGAMLQSYNVTIDLYLGPANTQKENAHALMLTMAERFRSAFWTDTTLGGRVFEAFISDAIDNLDTFDLEAGEPENMPRVSLTLRVREISTYT